MTFKFYFEINFTIPSKRHAKGSDNTTHTEKDGHVSRKSREAVEIKDLGPEINKLKEGSGSMDLYL